MPSTIKISEISDLHPACSPSLPSPPLQASLLAGRGEAAAALNAYQDALFRYQALSVRDPRIACVLMDAALLRDSLGLRADSERLAGAARVYMEAWTDALGLREMRVRGG